MTNIFSVKKLPINATLMGAFIVFVLIITGILFYNIENQIQSNYYNNEVNKSKQQISKLAYDITEKLNSQTNIIINSSQYLKVNRDTISIKYNLYNMIKSYDFILGLTYGANKINDSIVNFCPYYFRKNEKLYYSNLEQSNYYYKSENWFNSNIYKRKILLSAPYIDESKVPTTTLTVPLRRYDINSGVLSADIHLKFLKDITRYTRKYNKQNFCLVDKSSHIYYDFKNGFKTNKFLVNKDNGELIKFNNSNGKYTKGSDIYIYEYISPLNSYLFVRLNHDKLLANQPSYSLYFLIFYIIFGIFSFLAFWAALSIDNVLTNSTYAIETALNGDIQLAKSYSNILLQKLKIDSTSNPLMMRNSLYKLAFVLNRLIDYFVKITDINENAGNQLDISISNIIKYKDIYKISAKKMNSELLALIKLVTENKTNQDKIDKILSNFRKLTLQSDLLLKNFNHVDLSKSFNDSILSLNSRIKIKLKAYKSNLNSFNDITSEIEEVYQRIGLLSTELGDDIENTYKKVKKPNSKTDFSKLWMIPDKLNDFSEEIAIIVKKYRTSSYELDQELSSIFQEVPYSGDMTFKMLNEYSKNSMENAKLFTYYFNTITEIYENIKDASDEQRRIALALTTRLTAINSSFNDIINIFSNFELNLKSCVSAAADLKSILPMKKFI